MSIFVYVSLSKISFIKPFYSVCYLVTGTSKVALSIFLPFLSNCVKEILILSLSTLKPYPIADSEIAPTGVGSGYFEELTGQILTSFLAPSITVLGAKNRS